MTFQIRELEVADLPAFRSLRARGLRESPEAFGETAEHFDTVTLEQLASRLSASKALGGFSLGAFDAESGLVGVVSLARTDAAKMAHRGTLWGMYVAPEFRSRGIARKLIERLLARAAAADGLDQIHLSVVTTNTAACRLYQSCGFETYGTDPRVLKIGETLYDEYLMVRSLSSVRSVE